MQNHFSCLVSENTEPTGQSEATLGSSQDRSSFASNVWSSRLHYCTSSAGSDTETWTATDLILTTHSIFSNISAINGCMNIALNLFDMCFSLQLSSIVALWNPLPGAASAQAGCAGAAGQDGGGSGRRRLVRTAVLEQNINAASASCFSGYPHSCLTMVVFCFHVDSILRTEDIHICILYFINNCSHEGLDRLLFSVQTKP